MAKSFEYKISGDSIKDIEDFLDIKKLHNAAKEAIDYHATQIDFAIYRSVKNRYTHNIDTRKHRIGKSSSRAKRVKNLTTGGLVYLRRTYDLSKFDTTVAMGNINPSATKKGRVHTTQIIKGRRKVIYGKVGNGGFIPIHARENQNSPATRMRMKGGKTVMLERMGNTRKPSELLRGPTSTMMIAFALKNDTDVKKAVADFSTNWFSFYNP